MPPCLAQQRCIEGRQAVTCIRKDVSLASRCSLFGQLFGAWKMINMSRPRCLVINERSRHLRIQSRNRRKLVACYEALDRRSDERFCHIKVGIWDSGIGGLSVAAAVQDVMVSALSTVKCQAVGGFCASNVLEHRMKIVSSNPLHARPVSPSV